MPNPLFGWKKLHGIPPLEEPQRTSPNNKNTPPQWVLKRSKEHVREYRDMHGGAPINSPLTLEDQDYYYRIIYHQPPGGRVQREIYIRSKTNPFLLLLKYIYIVIKYIAQGILSLFGLVKGSDTQKASPNLFWDTDPFRVDKLINWSDTSYCPNCHATRRRYVYERFVHCHRCGWVVGIPLLRWLTHPTWIRYYPRQFIYIIRNPQKLIVKLIENMIILGIALALLQSANLI